MDKSGVFIDPPEFGSDEAKMVLSLLVNVQIAAGDAFNMYKLQLSLEKFISDKTVGSIE